MYNALRALWRGLIGRCPVCGMGRMFRSFFGLVEGCAQCGRRYEGTGNQSTGAMGIAITVTTALGFLGGFLLVIWLPDAVMWGLAALFGALAIVHAVLYRLSRGLWIGILAITGAIDEDENRDAFWR